MCYDLSDDFSVPPFTILVYPRLTPARRMAFTQEWSKRATMLDSIRQICSTTLFKCRAGSISAVAWWPWVTTCRLLPTTSVVSWFKSSDISIRIRFTPRLYSITRIAIGAQSIGVSRLWCEPCSGELAARLGKRPGVIWSMWNSVGQIRKSSRL